MVIMFKTEIEFSKNTLYVSIKGLASSKNIAELKRKLYYILNEYGVTNIVMDIKDIVMIDKDAFYDLLDDYDMKYGGNLSVVE